MKGRVLVVAGSDSGGGAGIQADIKTVTALGGYAATAITALTAQDTTGVHGVHDAPAAFVAEQMRVVLEDIGADAAKTGMLHRAGIVEAVADMLRRIDADYARQPAKPTFLCETWYEHDKDGGVFRIHKTGTTAAFRAHYWAARLHGGFGEGYGGWTNWLNLTHWRRDIERPGAVAIATHMRNILNALDWHNLAPDEDHAVLAPQPRIHAARSEASKTLVAYFEAPAETTLDPSWFGGRAELVWYDPANGAVLHRQTVAGSTLVRSPGGADAVLVVEAEAAAFD